MINKSDYYMSRNKSLLYMFFAAFCWSTGGLLLRLIDGNPFTVAGFRSLLSLPAIFLFFSQNKLRFTKKAWLIAIPGALTGFFYILSNKFTTAANAIVLMYISPVFIILIDVLIYREKARKEDIFAVCFSFLGIFLFFVDELSPGDLLGNILAILSGATNAILYVAMSRTNEDNGAVMIASQIEMLIIALPFMFLFPVSFTRKNIIAILLLGLFQKGVGSGLQAKAAKFCPALDAMLISMVEPLLNPLLVLVFIGEKPGKFALIGGMVVISTVVIWNIAKLKHTVTDS